MVRDFLDLAWETENINLNSRCYSITFVLTDGFFNKDHKMLRKRFYLSMNREFIQPRETVEITKQEITDD